VLGDRHRDAADVGLLEGICTNGSGGDLTGDGDDGDRVQNASAIGVTRLVAPGPLVAMQTPTLPLTDA